MEHFGIVCMFSMLVRVRAITSTSSHKCRGGLDQRETRLFVQQLVQTTSKTPEFNTNTAESISMSRRLHGVWSMTDLYESPRAGGSPYTPLSAVTAGGLAPVGYAAARRQSKITLPLSPHQMPHLSNGERGQGETPYSSRVDNIIVLTVV